MKLALVFVFLIFSIPARAGEITIASFNCYWLFQTSSSWYAKTRGDQPYSEAISGVAKVIKSLDADIIGLQEIQNKAVIADLTKAIKALGKDYKYSWVGKAGGQNVALLSMYKSVGEPILKFEDREGYLLEAGPTDAESDTAASKAIRVDLDVDGVTLPVFVTHLKSQLPQQSAGYLGSDNQRKAQASIIRRLILPLIKSGKRFVVMGDLNAGLGSPTLRRIRGFDDVGADLIQPALIERKASGAKYPTPLFSGNRWSHVHQGRTKLIDHILLAPAFNKRDVKSGRVLFSHPKTVSDHGAVVIKVKID